MKNKIIFIILGLLVVVAIGFSISHYGTSKKISPESVTVTDPKNATYTIDGQPVTLVNGISSVPAAPGSATKIVTQYFGNEVTHDFNGDGRPDVAFILTQNTGGSGTFYYVVVALNTASGFVGSQGFLIGDRIVPQTLEMSQDPKTPNVIVVNYADRKPGESFATQPSVGKSKWLLLDPKTMQLGETVQN